MSRSVSTSDGEGTPLILNFSDTEQTGDNTKSPHKITKEEIMRSSVKIDIVNGNVRSISTKTTDSTTDSPLVNGQAKKYQARGQDSTRSPIGNSSYGSSGRSQSGRLHHQTSMLMRWSVSEVAEPMTLTWRDVNVYAPSPRTRHSCCKTQESIQESPAQILKGVSGMVEPRNLLAILGASGAGKTTLLNVLTYRNRGDFDVEGDIKVNGQKIGRGMEAMSAYVQQDDLFIGTLTVKEHLWFQSQLRVDKEIPQAVRRRRVAEVLKQVGLEKCADTYIGIPGKIKGISGGEKKRLAVASEVLTNPPLLFLDEPTSGLDAFMARNIVSLLKSMAAQGRTIICTIHQPSSKTFELFDRVLLLAEGRTAFLGPSQEALEFFERCGHPCPKNYNPADHYIHTLAVQPAQEDECRSQIKTICDSYDASVYSVEVAARINTICQQEEDFGEYEESAFAHRSPYKAGIFCQFRALLWRSWLSSSREPGVFRTRFGQTLILSLVFGLLYLPLSERERYEYDQDRVDNLNGALFLMLAQMTFGFSFAVITAFPLEFPVFLREHHDGMYRVSVYYLSKMLAELPQFIFLPVVFTAVMYWLVFLYPSVEAFSVNAGIMILVCNAAVSFGYMLSSISSNVTVILALAPVLVIPAMVLGGYYIKDNTIPFYLNWMKYLSWFRYSYENALYNQWKDVKHINCTQPLNTSAVACASTGEGVIRSWNFSGDNVMFNYIMLLVLIFGFRLVGYIILFIRSRRRYTHGSGRSR